MSYFNGERIDEPDEYDYKTQKTVSSENIQSLKVMIRRLEDRVRDLENDVRDLQRRH